MDSSHRLDTTLLQNTLGYERGVGIGLKYIQRKGFDKTSAIIDNLAADSKK